MLIIVFFSAPLMHYGWQEAEKELAAATLDRDRAHQDLDDFRSNHNEEINAR